MTRTSSAYIRLKQNSAARTRRRLFYGCMIPAYRSHARVKPGRRPLEARTGNPRHSFHRAFVVERSWSSLTMVATVLTRAGRRRP